MTRKRLLARLLVLTLASASFLVVITVRQQKDNNTSSGSGSSIDDDRGERGRRGWNNDFDPNGVIDLNKVDAVLGNEGHGADALFDKVGGSSSECYLPGTDVDKTETGDGDDCVCLPTHFGPDCGVPAAVWSVPENRPLRFTRRGVPRRMVIAITVNHETEMLRILFGMLVLESAREASPTVVAIAEGNLTAAGEPKELHFAQAIKGGAFDDLAPLPPVLYVLQDHFPEGAVEDGWAADRYMRSHLSRAALARLRNLREDDLLLCFDADETPNPDVLSFLRLYDGMGQPPILSFNFRWTVYGYFWRRRERHCTAPGATVGFLRDVCDGDVYSIRKRMQRKWCSGWHAYHRRHGGDPDWRSDYGESDDDAFKIGTANASAGHHCSWCLGAEGIRTKMLSAQKQDKPRWGDMPDKTRIPYIEKLIRKGRYFDWSALAGKRTSLASGDPEFAPGFVLGRQEEFEHLLLHPDDRQH